MHFKYISMHYALFYILANRIYVDIHRRPEVSTPVGSLSEDDIIFLHTMLTTFRQWDPTL